MADQPTVRRATTPARVIAVRPGHATEVPDTLVTEEPMEVRVSVGRVDATTVTVTMRTPGHDFELAAGFLLGEGLVELEDIASIRYCDLPDDEVQRYNTVTVDLRGTAPAPRPARMHTVSSACGVCGTTSLAEVAARCPPVAPGSSVDRSVLLSLPDRLRRSQRVFDRTGGLHAAAAFTTEGELVAVREDVGRHNAMDKLVGWAALDGRLPLADHVVMVSGRLGFEIVQKAAAAGVPVLAAVSAPTSLAVATAEALGVTVVGFLRGERFNIYSHASRVALDA